MKRSEKKNANNLFFLGRDIVFLVTMVFFVATMVCRPRCNYVSSESCLGHYVAFTHSHPSRLASLALPVSIFHATLPLTFAVFFLFPLLWCFSDTGWMEISRAICCFCSPHHILCTTRLPLSLTILLYSWLF